MFVKVTGGALTDRLLGGAKPAGYWSQPKSHNAVGVAVAQNRADWGIAIETNGLGFIPAQDENGSFESKAGQYF